MSVKNVNLDPSSPFYTEECARQIFVDYLLKSDTPLRKKLLAAGLTVAQANPVIEAIYLYGYAALQLELERQEYLKAGTPPELLSLAASEGRAAAFEVIFGANSDKN